MTHRASSPLATGGAGTFFEQHVDAYWLAQLLVRGIAPIVHDCVVVEVHFQCEHLGWNTDDFLVVGENGSGVRRKLAGQVKRAFTVSAADEDCRKTFRDFWSDFRDAGRFSRDADRLALVILRGTNVLLGDFMGLLDGSRAARDGEEFERRLATPGVLSHKAVQHCDAVRAIIGEVERREVSAAEVWPFLRVLHVLSLDLDSSTSQTAAMIRTLLAHTTNEHDAIRAAEASWDALLREVGSGMPAARSYGRDNIPEALRRRHSPVGDAGTRVIRALGDHSSVVLSGIRSAIGPDLHLGRARLVQRVIQELESTRVVLITGPAGSGKSTIAKDVTGVLAADHFAFCFRAGEFEHPHLDATLQGNQIPANAATLGAILAGQARKVLLVESVERLFEASTRDAFADLLTLVANDEGWRLILTCRDYSAGLVRDCFLRSDELHDRVVAVPPLDDGELEEAGAAYPGLRRPLANATLRQLLRNPYVLDKALRIPWSEGGPLPRDEREFRALFWREIVRADHRTAGGMPRRREEAFAEIAIRRATTLNLYAASDDLDAEAIRLLIRDSVVAESPQGDALVAPAHDVLEDWAILRWIDGRHATHRGSPGALSAAFGTCPAVRRTYRKWVGDLVVRDATAADELFRAVATATGGIPAHFRDDTLASMLRSTAADAFLGGQNAELFAEDKRLLRRVIHLLRVACVAPPDWLPAAASSSLNVPDGTAWACILRLVRANLGAFARGDLDLILGLIEDWARGVTVECPYPDGSEAVAAIAHWLLPQFDDYRSRAQQKRTLRIIAKIPNGDRDRFAMLLKLSQDDSGRDHAAEDLRDLIFGGLEGFPAGRDAPELMASAAIEFFLCSEADLGSDWGYGLDMHRESRFGFKTGRSHLFFPASAFRGPFLALLRHHPRRGLDCIVAILNHSADWYARPRRPPDYFVPPPRLTLTFEDGTTRGQWCDARLWDMYRGTSSGPYVLQSLLMALERWLLEMAELRPGKLDEILLQILRRSDTVALTAVVASVATAAPHSSPETLLVLLRSRHCIMIDRPRLVSESQAPSRLYDMIPGVGPRAEVYEQERKEADAMPHRRHDLELAIANLQMGPLATRVHEMLDRHRAELPPFGAQTEADRIWRIALHRMDVRRYITWAVATEDPTATEVRLVTANAQHYVIADPELLETDIRRLSDQSAARFRTQNAKLDLLLWGRKVFDREDDWADDAAQWRPRLREARDARHDGEDLDLSRGGPGFVAAVCIRDRWDEMTDDERGWCLDTSCSAVEQDADNWDPLARERRAITAADRPCAWVLSLLVDETPDDARRLRIQQSLVIALTHPSDQVRSHAVSGVGVNLWPIDRALAMRCVNALALQAALVRGEIDAGQDGSPHRRRGFEIEAGVAAAVRRRFFEKGGIPDEAHGAFDATQSHGAEANRHILRILGQAPAEPAANEAFRRFADTLVAWWDADDDRHRDRAPRPERNYETEAASRGLLEDFLLRTTTEAATVILRPILNAVDRHPSEVDSLLLGLIKAEDRRPDTPRFWSLWSLFADRVRGASWLDRVDDEHPSGDSMVSAVFLGTRWKEGARHWPSLEGYEHLVHRFFTGLPASSTVLGAYVRFLYHVGERSLPQAFARVATQLRRGDPMQLLGSRDTVRLLEVILRRHVYRRPAELKRHDDLRDAVLSLLDMLVERGSSAAYRMRDDFVTPLGVDH